MGLFVVDGYPQQLDILTFEFAVRITERACFLRSAGCIVFRIEEKYDALSREVGQANRIAVLVLRLKVWCLFAFFEHKPPEK